MAGLISYQHIEDLSLTLHQTIMVARLMPFGVDGLITVGSVVLLQGGRLGWLGIIPGVAISLFANVGSGIRYGVLAAIRAGIPAVSFFLATFILERWLQGQKGQVHATVADVPVIVPGAMADNAPDHVHEDVPGGVHENVPRRRGVPEPRRTTVSLAEAERHFAADVAAGRTPSFRAIRQACRVGDDKARVIRAHLTSLIAGGLAAQPGVEGEKHAAESGVRSSSFLVPELARKCSNRR